MTIEDKLIQFSMKLNLEILSFQKELYEISQSNIDKEELLQVTEDINYVVGSLTIHNLAIEQILNNIINDSSYKKNNEEFLTDYLNKLQIYCEEFNIGID